MSDLRKALGTSVRMGLIVGFVALFVALEGIVEVFSERDIISSLISLGHAVLLLLGIGAGYLAGRGEKRRGYLQATLLGVVAGLLTAGVLALFALTGTYINLRYVLVNATDSLIDILTFNQGLGLGIGLLLAVGGVLGGLGGAISQLSLRFLKTILIGGVAVLLLGILQELFSVILSSLGVPEGFIRFLFERKGLTPIGSTLIFILFGGLSLISPRAGPHVSRRLERSTPYQRTILHLMASIVGVAVLVFLPNLLKVYWTDVVDNIGLFILMGLGLNIVVGYAGLLDLGYVAFYAIGAYTVGLLTSPNSWLGMEWSFWRAWPIAAGIAALSGIILGVPVLRMRGDYLAIVTLGFGEIIRILALSDLLKPYVGGAQGILQVPKPAIGNLVLLSSGHLYYLILAGCLFAIFVSLRLSDSRVGRAWIAIREDEDVAKAMGINVVYYKLLAFAIGATFGGISGAIFASKLSSIFPHSFNLIISINVLCLIIVGGIASIPGVVVGALVMLGLPEVLREFAEYRMLMYGALLVVMMLARPEGFWPAARRRRELHGERAHTAAEE